MKIFNRAAGGKKIEKLSNGFLIAGNTPDSTITISKVFLLKIDNFGNTLSTNLVNSNITERLTDFIILNPNRYAFTSYDLIAKSMITDFSGSITVQKNYPTKYYTYLFSILRMNNGDILWGGVARFGLEDADVWIIRSDSLLNFPPIGIQPIVNLVPSDYVLYQNYPNPFNPQTKIKFSVKKNSFISIIVYNTIGEEVARLVNSTYAAGEHNIIFEANDLPTGVYFYQLKINDLIAESKKMVLVK